VVRAVKSARAGQTTCAALLLNDARGQPTDAAEAILRAGRALIVTET